MENLSDIFSEGSAESESPLKASPPAVTIDQSTAALTLNMEGYDSLPLGQQLELSPMKQNIIEEKIQGVEEAESI